MYDPVSLCHACPLTLTLSVPLPLTRLQCRGTWRRWELKEQASSTRRRCFFHHRGGRLGVSWTTDNERKGTRGTELGLEQVGLELELELELEVELRLALEVELELELELGAGVGGVVLRRHGEAVVQGP